MALIVVRRKMFNGGGLEWYVAVSAAPLMPVPTPRVRTQEELIERLEAMLEVAKSGPVVEVKE
jgi:hypothetical protein